MHPQTLDLLRFVWFSIHMLVAGDWWEREGLIMLHLNNLCEACLRPHLAKGVTQW